MSTHNTHARTHSTKKTVRLAGFYESHRFHRALGTVEWYLGPKSGKALALKAHSGRSAQSAVASPNERK